MTRQLWLLRHADAEPHGARPDRERRLTARGERQSQVAGRALARIGVEPDAIICSPKERALMTATLALEEWEGMGREALSVYEPLAQGFDADRALAELERLGPSARLLAVGHEPDLSEVAAELTGGRIDLKKGGLAVVRIETPSGPGARSAAADGELVLVLRPVELALIAGLGDIDV